MMSPIEFVGMLANIATILGIPIAIILFVNEKRKERREREYGTYNTLDEKYIEYLRLCMEHPELDLYEVSFAPERELSGEQKVRQYAMFEILVSLFERAYLMYRDQSSTIKKVQWSGWNEYMHNYAKRTTFRRLWQLRGTGYDLDFIKYINSVLEMVESEV